MKREKRILAFVSAAVFVLCTAVPAVCTAVRGDLSAYSFSMKDVVGGETVVFHGNAGRPAVLLFGGLGSDQNTAAYVADLLQLLRLASGGTPQVYLVDVGSNSDRTIRAQLGKDPLPKGVYAGAEGTLRGDSVLYYAMQAVVGKGATSYTLPLAAYLDENGVVADGTTGFTTRDRILTALRQIGTAVSLESVYADIPFNVRFLQTGARGELAAVNALRTGSGAWIWNPDGKTKTVLRDLRPLTYDYALERVAMQRAVELIALYEHERPNGDSIFTVHADEGYRFSAAAENIAWGYQDAAAVQAAWEEADQPYALQGHRRNMLSGDYTAFGSACVEYEGRRCYVQEFSDTVNEAAPTPAKDTAAVATIRFALADLGDWTVEPAQVRIGVGQRQALDALVSIGVSYRGRNLKTALSPVWKSANPDVVSVDATGSLTGVSVGTAALFAAMPQSGARVRLTVTVREKAVDNTPIGSPLKEVGDRVFAVPGTTLLAALDFLGQETSFSLRYRNGEWEPLPDTVYTGLKAHTEKGDRLILVPGDADGDGMVTAADARTALRISVGLEADGTLFADACRVDGDWSAPVDAGKARLILRGAVGLEDPLEWFRDAG